MHFVLLLIDPNTSNTIAIGTLAWRIYRSRKEAPESFKDISLEVLSLHAVLKEAEEILFAHPLSTTKQ
jgi:hypothetical protein